MIHAKSDRGSQSTCLELDDVQHLVGGQIQLNGIIHLHFLNGHDVYTVHFGAGTIIEILSKGQCVNSLKNLHFNQKLDPSLIIMSKQYGSQNR